MPFTIRQLANGEIGRVSLVLQHNTVYAGDIIVGSQSKSLAEKSTMAAWIQYTINPFPILPTTGSLAPAYVSSLVVALLLTLVSAIGLLFQSAIYPTEELAQSFVVTDLVNLVIGVPIYNFGIPAKLKAWVDMIARARKTFRYTSSGPEGLLKGKKAFVIVPSGGVPVGSPVDFATPYLRHALEFVGITDVEFIGAGDDPWGGYRAGFEGTTSFAMADFGILKDLGPKSKDVEMILSVEGIRQ